MVKVLMKMGATVWAWTMVYKVVFQMVLPYRREIFVVTEAMLKVMEGFQH